MKRLFQILVLFFVTTVSVFGYTISVGDEVMSVHRINVRSCASTSCSRLGTIDTYTVGIVKDGIKDNNGYYWWKIKWEDGNYGWTATPKSGQAWYYEKPTGLYPGRTSSNPEVINTTTPTLHWNKIDGVHHYEIITIKKSNGDITYHENISGNSTSYTLKKSLEEGERYLWSIIPYANYNGKDYMGLKANYIYFDVKKKAQSKYDLTIKPNYIKVNRRSGNDNYINVGEKINIRAYIENIGDKDSDSFKIKYYYKDNTQSDFGSYFDTDSNNGIKAGKIESETSKEITITGKAGTQWIKVCIYNNSEDADHNNDCAIISFEVKKVTNNNDKPTIYSINPTDVKSSYAERTIVLEGKNFSNAILQISLDNQNFFNIEPELIKKHSYNKIELKYRLLSIKYKDKYYWTKYQFRLIKNNENSNIKEINVNYQNLAPLVVLKSPKTIDVNSKEKFNIKLLFLDLEDLFSNKKSKLYIEWGDGAKTTITEYKETTVSHSYTSTHNTTKTISIYAKDSDNQKSNIIQVKVNIKGSSDSTDIKKQVFANSHHDKVAKQSLCNQANNSVGRSIDRATGAENFTITTMVEHGLFDLPLTLKYNSILLDGSFLGKGWSHNYNVSSYIEILDNDYHGKVRVHWDNSNKKFNDFVFYEEKGDYRIYKSTELATKDDILIRKEDDSFELKRKDGTIYKYDKTKYLKYIENKKHQIVNVTFDEAGRLTQVKEPKSGLFLSYYYNKNGQLVRVRDKLDRITYFYYNNKGLLQEIEAPDGIIKYLFHYNNNDQLYKYELVDKNHNKIQYFDITYDTNGKASVEEDGNGNISQFFYNTTKESGKIHSTYINKAGETTKTIYDATDFRPYNITYSDGTTEHYEYYSDGRKKSFTNRAGYTTNYYYDSRGNIKKVHYSDGSEELYEYDDNRNLTKKTIKDKNGKSYTTINTYDSNNNLISQTIKNSAGQDLVTTYTYNDNNQMTSKTIGGKTTYYRYEKGRLKEVETPNGLITSYTYDNAGRLKTKTTPQTGTTTYEYDVMDNITKITNSLNKSKTFKYDFRGNKIEEKDFNGNITQYKYDNNGNLIQKIDALGNIWKFEYDSADRLQKSIDPLGNYITYQYDSMGRLYKKTDKRGNTTKYSYDAMGNLKSQTDPNGYKLFTNKYDSKNNLIETINILNHKTTNTYTVFNKIKSQTDPLNRVTQFIYDDIGRLIEVINADGKSATQKYNLDGTIKEFTDPNGNKTQFTYNNDGQLTSTTTASGSTQTNTYNQNGLLETFKNGRGDLKHFTYDNLGRVKEAKDKDGTIKYTYDNNGNLLTISENGKTATYTYDALNQIKSYTNFYNQTIYYDYDALGNLIKLTYPNGKVIEYKYDKNSNLIELKDGNLITTFKYTKNNRLYEMIRPNGTILELKYNEAGQLIKQIDKTPNGENIYTAWYDYNNVENIKKETRIPEVAPTKPINITMTYKQGNLLKEYNNTIGHFDKDDNLINLGSKTFTYDSRNRLISFNNTSYIYDAQNHRIAQTTNNKTTKYTINPNAPLSQTLIIDNNGVKTTYIYGNALLYQEQNGKKLYYHYDLRGSTIALTDENGNIVDRYSYLPYGELNSHDLGTTKTPFLYNGRDGVMSEDNGLYYMRARYYDPTIKRFINRDTLLGEIGDMASLNRFAYVNGNPVIGVDPLGLWWSSWKEFTDDVSDFFKNIGFGTADEMIKGKTLKPSVKKSINSEIKHKVFDCAIDKTIGNENGKYIKAIGNIVTTPPVQYLVEPDSTRKDQEILLEGEEKILEYTATNIIVPYKKKRQDEYYKQLKLRQRKQELNFKVENRNGITTIILGE